MNLVERLERLLALLHEGEYGYISNSLNRRNTQLEYVVNPTPNELQSFLKDSKGKELRFVLGKNFDIIFFDAFYGDHPTFIKDLKRSKQQPDFDYLCWGLYKANTFYLYNTETTLDNIKDIIKHLKPQYSSSKFKLMDIPWM